LSLDSIEQSVQSAALGLNERLRRHPRRVAAAVCMLLGGFAVTAFGIAPLAPDAADLPQRLVTQELPLSGIEQQLEDLAQHALELARTDLTRASDTADSLLRRLGVTDPAAAAFLRTDREGRRLFEGRPGKMIQVRTDEDGALKELVARFPALDSAQQLTHFTRLTVTRFDGRFLARLDTAPLRAQVRLGSGTIRTSLFAATDDARLPDSLAGQLVDIFSTDIDFHRQLRKGDTFSVVYEALTADDQPITWNEGTGRILAAEFTNNGKVSQAVWFKDASGRGAYFTMDGQSKRRSFLASPMEFSRVTSGFAMRMHPILQTWRAHNGVDYGAPTGTPVRTVGDGIVDFAGWQNGYGNVVHVKHAGEKTTVYAHLSKLDVRKGQKVDQGQRIGLVGATGWATGPHLHFEFRVNGQFQDPLQVARAAETVVVDAAARPRFMQMASAAQSQLDAAESLIGSRGDAE
jgi:murein DD-endopeptidase MepM/ murein hydrolase activator NlpD